MSHEKFNMYICISQIHISVYPVHDFKALKINVTIWKFYRNGKAFEDILYYTNDFFVNFR